MPHCSPGPRVVGVEILANQVACSRYYDIILANRYIFVDIYLDIIYVTFEEEELGQEETLEGLGRGCRGGGWGGLGGGQQESRHQAGERQHDRLQQP